MKRVIVSGYTFETNLNLTVGDVVVVPTKYWLKDIMGDTWEGTVLSLTSDYTGDCARIIRKKKR